MSIGLKKKLKGRLAKVREAQAKVHIGKNGITPAIISEIDAQLERTEILKVKFLRNFITEDFDQAITKVAKETKAALVEKKGRTIILYRSSATKEKEKTAQ